MHPESITILCPICLSPHLTNRHRRPAVDRFWPKVNRGELHWLWTGGHNRPGYGVFWGDTQRTSAHRFAWTLADGAPPPDGRMVLHTCDIPACVRNDEPGVYIVNGIQYPRWGHLFLANGKVNAEDRMAKGRHVDTSRAAGLTRIRNGYVTPVRGERQHSAKLTDALVSAIRADYATGEWRQVDLAVKYGINQSSISAVLRGTTWRHVT